VSASDRVQLVRDVYGAYESGGRAVVEWNLSDDFIFYAPSDPGIERRGRRDLPGNEDRRPPFRNTEIFGFDGDKIGRVEVYFGWNLE
jgi:hypothetical protein